MRKIIVLSMISLDGVMQAPGARKEDTSGGFKYGGWMASYTDAAYDEVVQKELHQKSDYLLGKGKKLFDNGAIPGAFTLTKSSVTSKGVIIAYYKRAGKVKTGNVKA